MCAYNFKTCRQILVGMIITSYILQFAVRVNISIAIVDMVINNSTNVTNVPRYDWNETERNNVLGSFFWGNTVMAFFAGRLSEVYGTRKVMGTAMLISGIFTVLTPLACNINYYLLLIVRVSVGAGAGVAWSSIMPLAIRWFAVTERSKFLAHIAASQLGGGLCLALSGYLIDNFGWPCVFYVCGVAVLLWCILWFSLVYDSPKQHPKIRNNEDDVKRKNKFESDIDKRKVPWLKIFKSRPVWTIVIGNLGGLWNINFATLYIPSYLNDVLHLNIKENGFLSSLPFIGSYSMAVLTCYLADKMRKKDLFSLLTIRKIFTATTFSGSIVCLCLLLTFSSEKLVAIIAFILWQISLATAIAGFVSNIVDLTPTYSGSVHGISNGFGAFSGYLCTLLFDILVHNKQNFKEWCYMFWVLIAVDGFAIIFYFVFGSADIQNWDPLSRSSTDAKNLGTNKDLDELRETQGFMDGVG